MDSEDIKCYKFIQCILRFVETSLIRTGSAYSFQSHLYSMHDTNYNIIYHLVGGAFAVPASERGDLTLSPSSKLWYTYTYVERHY